jgi:hypothetical protein
MWKTFIAVLWAFLGIRSRKGYDHDRGELKVSQVIVVGIFCALMLVGGLVVLVTVITGK